MKRKKKGIHGTTSNVVECRKRGAGENSGEGAGLRLWGAKPIGSDVVTRREKSEWIEPPVSTWWCNVINVSRSWLSLIL